MRHRSRAICAGSSPLTRGKPAHSVLDTPAVGLIPAHAGKTARRRRTLRSRRAHPHSCGDNHREGCNLQRTPGSPPLTQGKLRSTRADAAASGLIPAHAGKTARSTVPTWEAGAHPRSRGENSCHWLTFVSPTGSSPLMRGKRQSLGGRRHQEGLIPTHARKTSDGSGATIYGAAHPRSCGENTS